MAGQEFGGAAAGEVEVGLVAGGDLARPIAASPEPFPVESVRNYTVSRLKREVRGGCGSSKVKCTQCSAFEPPLADQ